MARSTPEGVAALLDPVVTGAGFFLEGVTITPAGKRSVVRVVVDLPDDAGGSLDLDQVAEASRAVSDALDSSDVLGAQAYVLEVSSPGVDRPLTERRHWSRARGRLVTTTADGEPLAGRVTSVDDAGVVLAGEAGERAVAWARLGRGAVQVEFRRPDDADDSDDDRDSGGGSVESDDSEEA